MLSVSAFCPFFGFFLGHHPRHMESWVESGLQHSSRQRRILNPLSEASDRARDLMVPSQIRFHCTTTGTPISAIFQTPSRCWSSLMTSLTCAVFLPGSLAGFFPSISYFPLWMCACLCGCLSMCVPPTPYTHTHTHTHTSAPCKLSAASSPFLKAQPSSSQSDQQECNPELQPERLPPQ